MKDVPERPQLTGPKKRIQAFLKDNNPKLGEGPSSSWGEEEVVKEEGLAFGVPYWDQVSVQGAGVKDRSSRKNE